VLVIGHNVAVRTACEHQVHVQIEKISFRDSIGQKQIYCDAAQKKSAVYGWFSQFKIE
jgi:hypothetical protein